MSYLKQTKELFQKLARPLSSADLVLHLEMTLIRASKTMATLAAAGCIEQVSGNVRTGRFYQWRPGADLPSDQRGKSEGSRSALRRRAARRAHPTAGRVGA